MTVQTTKASSTFPGNGTTTSFPCDWKIFANSDIAAFFINAMTGVSTGAVINTDYTVSGAGADNGFTVTTTVPVPIGTNLYVKRNLPFTQPTSIKNQGAFFPSLHEDAFDRTEMQVQQIADAQALGVTLPPGMVPTPSGVMPAPALNNIIGWADDLGGFKNVPIPDAGTGTYSPGFTGAVASRLIADKLREFVSVLDFGADATGTNDSTAAFNAALAASASLAIASYVYVPPGTYKILDAVNVPSGVQLWGIRHKSTIKMATGFNGSALGGLVFAASEPGPELRGITITQDQPDSTTATVFPPAIYAQNCPRFKVAECRLQCVYDGIDMRGNSGGAVIDDLELSALHIGINIDGCADTVKISRVHLWPFGLTTNQRVSNTASTGIKVGVCTTFVLTQSIILGIKEAVYFFNSGGNYPIASISDTDFDSAGGLHVDDGTISVTGCLFTYGGTYNSTLVYQTGGKLYFSACRFAAGGTSTSPRPGWIGVIGGQCTLTGCYIQAIADGRELVYTQNASTSVIGSLLSRPTNVSYANAQIRYGTGGTGTVMGNNCDPVGTGTSSKFVEVDADVGVTVTGNYVNGHSIGQFPSAFKNIVVDNNFGASDWNSLECYTGYFSGDGTTTVKLPHGWSLSRLGAGNYSVTHNLGTSAVTDVVWNCTGDFSASGIIAAWDIGNSSINIARLRAYVGTTLTDSGISFTVRRRR